MLLERYRIVSLLGSGGMGEVYRADDLELGQSVALKFLPEVVVGHAARLQRFRNEVRIARQVSHPNVCRVYDLGDVEGFYFLSMEYVDGEDLSAVLRRMGRPSGEKLLEIARQLCAGLAAAHANSVLHRDLKPANIMIDGRGRVRITDFGLATFAKDVDVADRRSGTPAYMSPEQAAGQEITVQSDIYALGLVLYELCTAKRYADRPGSTTESHADAMAALTSTASDVDPAMERVIRRCLDPDPRRRPPSAIAVAAALPGGDPLAAAIAAGETPSPELVAAAARSEGMHPLSAIAVAAVGVALFVLSATWIGHSSIRAYSVTGKPPVILMDRAHEVIERLGYVEPVFSDPVDYSMGYGNNWGWVSWITDHSDDADRWRALATTRPAVGDFWYRQSPRLLLPLSNIAPGQIRESSPIPVTPGELIVRLDRAGRLARFLCVPRQYTPETVVHDEPDWQLFFELADIDIVQFESTTPKIRTRIVPEQRAAWIGALPEHPEIPIRIEAGYAEGRPTFFAVLWPWDLEAAAVTAHKSARRPSGAPAVVGFWFLMLLLAGSATLVRRNLRRGRADRRGALRVAAVVFLAVLATFMLGAHRLFSSSGSAQVVQALACAGFLGGLVWLMYLALEPFARQVWPSMLISWSRAMSSSVSRRDPVIGKAVIAGVFAGGLIFILYPMRYYITTWLSTAPPNPLPVQDTMLIGSRFVVSGIFGVVTSAITNACMLAFTLVAARLILRIDALAIVVAFVLMTLVQLDDIQSEEALWGSLVAAPLASIIMVTVLLRCGLLALVIATLVGMQMRGLAVTATWSEWHAQPAIIAVVVVAGMAAYGAWAATAGRSLLPEEV
jgi:serine/threonine-protein kinase